MVAGLQKVKICGPTPVKQTNDPTLTGTALQPIRYTPELGIGFISKRNPIAPGLRVMLNLIDLSPSGSIEQHLFAPLNGPIVKYEVSKTALGLAVRLMGMAFGH